MNQKIKWGILGYARIAHTEVIPAILRTENSEFYALASRNPDNLEEAQRRFGCTKVYHDYQQVLDDPQVQAVYIPLPNTMHKEWAIKAMCLGKHVLCEKPFAMNQAECLEMIKVAEREKVLLTEAFMYRYTERTRKVQEILDSGLLGQIKYINATYRFFLDRPNTIKIKPELGGGSLYDVGCYPVNFVGMVTGKEPVSYAVECVKENDVDILFSAVLKYDNGVLATINSGFNAYRRIFAEIVGTNGVLEVPDTFLGTAGCLRLTTDDGCREIPIPESDRYGLEISDFAQAILENRLPKLDINETIRNMKVIDHLLKQI